jgi:hypothetical protein
MNKAKLLLALLFILVSGGPSLAAQSAEPGPRAAGAKLIAVFAYGDSGGFLKREDAFARYAIPDMIRSGISQEGRFSLADKAACDDALAKAGAAGEATEEQMRAAARDLGADHFIWGYIGSLGDGIGVFHRVVETESGLTLHESFGRLPSGQGIFDALEKSVGELQAWIATDLPLRGPDVVYVEKEVVVEKPAAPKDGGGLGIGADASYRFFILQFADWLRPAPRAGLSLDLKEWPGRIRLGFLVESSPLFQVNGGLMVMGGVTVLQTSIDARASLSLPIAKGLAFRCAALAGASFFAGYVSPQVIAYVRPTAALSACLEWSPARDFALALECRAEVTPYAWGNAAMVDVSPGLYLRYLP